MGSIAMAACVSQYASSFSFGVRSGNFRRESERILCCQPDRLVRREIPLPVSRLRCVSLGCRGITKSAANNRRIAPIRSIISSLANTVIYELTMVNDAARIADTRPDDTLEATISHEALTGTSHDVRARQKSILMQIRSGEPPNMRFASSSPEWPSAWEQARLRSLPPATSESFCEPAR